jgi:hypothetical protein
MAGLITGEDYPVNPLEGFLLGGAILLHDLANSLAAFPDGVDGLKGPEWDDALVSHFMAANGRRPSADEAANPSPAIRDAVIFERLRQVHAAAAVRLAKDGL